MVTVAAVKDLSPDRDRSRGWPSSGRPVAVGFFFLLGHSAPAVVVAALAGGCLSTGVSAPFLLTAALSALLRRVGQEPTGAGRTAKTVLGGMGDPAGSGTIRMHACGEMPTIVSPGSDGPHPFRRLPEAFGGQAAIPRSLRDGVA